MMIRSHGWGLSPGEVLLIRLLDWIYERSAGGTSGHPGLQEFAEAEDVFPHIVDREARVLEQQGLVRFGAGRLGAVGMVYLTDEGRHAVEQRRQRREDPSLRRRACRDAFLAWLDAQAGSSTTTVATDGFLRDNRSIYEGGQFDIGDVDAATAYLRDRGLISGVEVAEFGGPVRASITAAGLDCVDSGGSVSDFLTRGQAAGTTITTHFHGPVPGQVGIGNTVHQTQHQGIDGDTLERLLDDVREAAKEIDPADAEYLLAYVDTLRAEAAADHPDPALIKGSTNRLKQIATRVGNPAVSASVSTLTTALLSGLGLS